MNTPDVSPKVDYFFDILDEGEAHPKHEDLQRMLKNFETSLEQQYFDIKVSLCLEAFVHTLENASSLGVLTREISQHALIVITQFLKDSAAYGIDIWNWSGWWQDQVNTEERHEEALQRARVKPLDDAIPVEFKPVPSNVPIDWQAVVKKFITCLDEMFGYPHSLGRRELLYKDIRGQYENSPYDSIRFWPPAAQALYLKDPERRQLLMWLKSQRDAAAIERMSLSSVPDSVHSEPRTWIMTSMDSGHGDAVPSATANVSELQSIPLPEDVRTLIENYYNLMAPSGTVPVVDA